MEAKPISGIAFLCDSSGSIVQILHDQLGLSAHIQPGKPFAALVEEGSRDKTRRFLEAIRQQGLVINWELFIPVYDLSLPLLFAGIVVGQHHLIVGSASHQSYENVVQLFDELSRINNEQINAFRDAVKDRSGENLPLKPGDNDIYASLSQLNNELSNSQRVLTKVNAELRLQRDRFQIILSSIGDAVIVTNTAGRITFMNAAAKEMTGYALEAFNFKHLDDLFFITGDAIQFPFEPLSVDAMHEYHLVEMLDQQVVFPKSGAEITVDLSCAPIRFRDEKMSGFVFVLRDRTARKRVEEQESQLSAEKEKVRILATFLRDASHDLRTPLTIMMTSLDLYERNPDPVNQQRHIHKLRNQVNQLHKYIETLILMAELDTKSKLDEMKTDLNALVEAVLAKNKHLADAKQVNMTLELDTSLPQIRLDPHHVDVAVTHLLKNAIFYTPEQGHVVLRTSRLQDNACIEVSDTGIGIEQEHLSLIFGRFYRVDEARSSEAGNSGMGLAIARRIVELHRGTIEVESTPGAGSTFRILIPLHRAEDG